MTIIIGAWTLPAIVTAMALGMMFRPYTHPYQFGWVHRIGWIYPIIASWFGYGIYLWMTEGK